MPKKKQTPKPEERYEEPSLEELEDLDLGPEDEAEDGAEDGAAEAETEAPVPVTGAHAHNHFCEVCLQPVAHCAGTCQHPGPQYCSAHVPIEHHSDPDHPYFGAKVEDKPVIRMHVKVED